jgi:4-hydroxybenzoate polyprenyltransferase
MRPVREIGSGREARAASALYASAFLRIVRPHQWSKNALLFLPMLAAHRGGDAATLLRAGLAFVAFSLCASSAYVLNDLLDVEKDRAHPTKRRRPFAAGDLPLPLGWVIAPALLAAGAAVAVSLGAGFAAIAGLYYVSTIAYSVRLKRVPMLDIMLLAGLYTLRLFSGAVAVDVPISSWLLSFSMFLFLSLAMVKRTSELRKHGPDSGGRGYLAIDEPQLAALGSAAGYVSVLVLALYVNGDHVRTLYAHPERLWLLCPLVLFWIGRIWLLANRGLVDDDPVVFALKDRASWAIGAIAAVVLFLAS